MKPGNMKINPFVSLSACLFVFGIANFDFYSIAQGREVTFEVLPDGYTYIASPSSLFAQRYRENSKKVNSYLDSMGNQSIYEALEEAFLPINDPYRTLEKAKGVRARQICASKNFYQVRSSTTRRADEQVVAFGSDRIEDPLKEQEYKQDREGAHFFPNEVFTQIECVGDAAVVLESAVRELMSLASLQKMASDEVSEWVRKVNEIKTEEGAAAAWESIKGRIAKLRSKTIPILQEEEKGFFNDICDDICDGIKDCFGKMGSLIDAFRMQDNRDKCNLQRDHYCKEL